MPGTDLKRKGEEGPFDGAAFPPLADSGQRTPPPGPRPHLWMTALVLSVVIHAAWMVLFWAFSGGGPGGSARLTVGTRITAAGPEVDFLISFPDDAPPPQPKALSPSTPLPVTPEPESTVPPAAPAPNARPDDRLDPRRTDGQSVPPPGRIGHPSYESGDVAANGNGHEGNGAAASFFQISVRGQRLVFVIDRSASMGLNGAFAAARRELLACLDHLAPAAQFQVIAYTRSAETLRVQGQSGLLTASTDHKQQARRLLEALRAEGGTDHLAALKRALLLRPDAIFFLTDADDLTEAQVREVTRFNRGRTAIHTVELTGSPRSQAPNPLQLLAAQNRGVYQGVDLSRDGPN